MLQVAKAVKRFKCTLHAFAVMGNHYHLLIETNEPNIPKVMHNVNSGYASYYNTRHDRKGYVFERRYWTAVIQKGESVKRNVRYIHMNPLRAGYERTVWGGYKWTSHGKYIGADDVSPADPDYALSLFGKDTKDAIPAYEKYIAASKKMKKNRVETEVYGPTIIGDRDFVQKMKLIACNRVLPEDISSRRELRKIVEPQKAVSAVSRFYGVSATVLCGKHGAWNTGKKVMIYLLAVECGLTYAEIGKMLGMHLSGISRAVSRFKTLLKENQGINKDLMKIRETIYNKKTQDK